MDNYLKHLLDKLPASKEFNKNEEGCHIRIVIENKYNDVVHHLENIGYIYKAISEIVLYLQKMCKVVVKFTLDEINILY